MSTAQNRVENEIEEIDLIESIIKKFKKWPVLLVEYTLLLNPSKRWREIVISKLGEAIKNTDFDELKADFEEWKKRYKRTLHESLKNEFTVAARPEQEQQHQVHPLRIYNSSKKKIGGKDVDVDKHTAVRFLNDMKCGNENWTKVINTFLSRHKTRTYQK
jgi:hypothetical protein